MESKTPLKAVDSKMSPTEHISRPNATQSSAYKLKKRYLELYTENSEDSGVLLSLERHAYENENSKPGKNQKIDSVQRTNNPTSLGTQGINYI
ncbi:hypothetical protein AX774_g7432 [Zancudomyces culisetae]|uniref:Uncharacterized protein n=1 Tax=Zancudomyces culisetae TaxID=1213189 RepID=A0A1R1PDV6_ZANCU|nr:hypothetical protein AX774_g7432 [Zancudomyces culisetae]|eukprot:OMH79164.1 hypothetical protein AX774_g7432 [Zancudomyces culisetae]